MKKTLLLKGFLSACLIVGLQSIAFGQKITSTDFSKIDVSAGLKTVFCPENAVFTLQAGEVDPVTGKPYTRYEWLEVNAAGGADAITGETSKTLSRTAVTPGYHTYRVYGLVDNGDEVVCRSDEYQDFTVFVLPPLNVNASAPSSSVLKYCNNAIPQAGDSKAIVFTAAVTGFQGAVNQVAGKTALTAADFAYDYKWYRVAADGTRYAVGANQDTYTVTGNEVGSWKYEVDIIYNVKNTCTVYKAVVQQNGADAQVVVTPTPGKPTITIL